MSDIFQCSGITFPYDEDDYDDGDDVDDDEYYVSRFASISEVH